MGAESFGCGENSQTSHMVGRRTLLRLTLCGEGALECGDVGEVPVEAPLGDTEGVGEPGDLEGGGSLGDEQPHRRGDPVGDAESCLFHQCLFRHSPPRSADLNVRVRGVGPARIFNITKLPLFVVVFREPTSD